MRAFKFLATVLVSVYIAWALYERPFVGAEQNDEVDRLTPRLEADLFADREAAEESLVELGRQAIPRMTAALAAADSPETRARLRRVLRRLTTLAWQRNLTAACDEAQSSGKAVLVFSTIGEPNGFSCLGANLMRSSTFADLELVDCLKRHFVLVWHNQAAELYSEEGEQEVHTAEEMNAYPQGGGGGNVRTYFCTSEGKVATYLEGFWRSKEFLREAKAAVVLCETATLSTDKEWALKVQESLASRRRALQAERAAVRKEIMALYAERKVTKIDVARVDGPFGLLDQSLAKSAELAMKPVEHCLTELAAERFGGAII